MPSVQAILIISEAQTAVDSAENAEHSRAQLPESGGADLLVTLGKAAGEANLDSLALVPAGEPDDVLRLP